VQTDWAAIACGFGYSLALKNDGSLWAWGLNNLGQLGLGDHRTRDVPTRVPGW
jgi:alpha-tubulin suppressor-like RCC1 family protein